ncbi:UreF-domain-containing protein [Fimicolochytrium jonesii]|uniref:UreF-domain-containing protein n=1 Tax=Fimicolochytrium jonesii TaxID=1396493 RepID=UPI0022FDC461|nr:UreF-domain-containing protein [Fimicolochytrium jonesii]KAI8816144.1 UreF-domain-containing protein [Fimicolochytrium jonesii]
MTTPPSQPIPTPTATEDWLLLLLGDSALPTGGFVASGGLEAAKQAGHVSDATQLRGFMRDAVHTYAFGGVPIVREAWGVMAGEGEGEGRGEREKIVELDGDHDTLIGTNHVARKASRAQGAAFLTLLMRGFPSERGVEIVKAFKTEVRASRSPGHLAVCFGIVCWSLGISLERTEHLFLFLHVRSLLSAAIRLNLVGPYQGQQMLLAAQADVAEVLRLVREKMELDEQQGGKYDRHDSTDDGMTGGVVENEDDADLRHHRLATTTACQTSPVVDILQGLHSQLYSRMFNS